MKILREHLVCSWYILATLNVYGVECVRLTKLIVPSYKYVGDKAVLSCNYDLEGEELYSVKWYKDGNEFYRFIPGERDQKVTVFSLPGVKVDERRSNRQTVTLLRLNLKSAGAYKCEISAEAPLFDTVSRIGRLSVIVLPNSQPRISGAKHTYHVGERVSVNCTSDRSKPAASLRWYINDMEAPNTWLHSYGPIKHEDGLETAILGLSFPVTEKSFLNQPGQLSLGLRCVSSIFTQNQKAHTVESKRLHEKDSKHFSYGSMLYSGSSVAFLSWPLLVLAFTSLSYLISRQTATEGSNAGGVSTMRR